LRNNTVAIILITQIRVNSNRRLISWHQFRYLQWPARGFLNFERWAPGLYCMNVATNYLLSSISQLSRSWNCLSYLVAVCVLAFYFRCCALSSNDDAYCIYCFPITDESIAVSRVFYMAGLNQVRIFISGAFEKGLHLMSYKLSLHVFATLT